MWSIHVWLRLICIGQDSKQCELPKCHTFKEIIKQKILKEVRNLLKKLLVDCCVHLHTVKEKEPQSVKIKWKKKNNCQN